MKRVIFGSRYESTGTVMKGGGGEVYVCNDPNLERLVVVKFLLPGVDKDRLQDEITALQRIRSKNVVQILDLVDDPARGLGVVAEYLSGNDLTVNIERPKTRNDMLGMIFKLANGLSDIHAAGIVHRDMKPNNVKYGDERILKIFDFNLARDEASARTAGFRGTHGFAAPEQYAAGVVHLTPKTDVYSLAATVACVALDGDLPKALMNTPPNPTAWAGGFSGLPLLDASLASLLDAALSVNPLGRPSADAIRSVTRNLLRRDSHRATITIRGVPNIYHLDAKHRIAQLAHSRPGGGTIEINYDGLDFVIKATTGTVLVNRIPCIVGQRLPDSCVIDLGSPSGKASDRQFVTFDLSHPEVVQ